jgi:hypothetical protein
MVPTRGHTFIALFDQNPLSGNQPRALANKPTSAGYLVGPAG